MATSLRRPGGRMATRPLHFFWIADCSGSMSIDGKIQALNLAIREALPHMRTVADDNPFAQVMLRAARFSHGADWHVPATPLDTFRWVDLVADPLQAAGADIVFMMDTTGSMSPYIEGLTQTCVKFADEVARAKIDAQLGLIGFGDLKLGERISSYSLTADVRQFQRDVRALPPTGGGDLPESSLDALVAGLDFPFRPDAQKVLVLITDAPPHDPDQAGRHWRDVLALAKARDALVYCIGPDLECWRSMAAQTDGEWYSIEAGDHFLAIIDRLGQSVAKEVTKRLAGGAVSAGTDLGAALGLLTRELTMPPMDPRAFPPVLVLISDGQPTDDWEPALRALMNQPWGKKAVRIAVAIGVDADRDVLQRFIGHPELKPLEANNPEALVRQIRWVSTEVLKAASAPESRPGAAAPSGINVPIPAAAAVDSGPRSALDVW